VDRSLVIAQVLRFGGVGMFLLGFIGFGSIADQGRTMSEQLLGLVAFPVVAVGGIVVAALGQSLLVLAHMLRGATDTAFFVSGGDRR